MKAALARPRSAPSGVAAGEVGAPPRHRRVPLEPTRQCGEKCKPGKEFCVAKRPRVRRCAISNRAPKGVFARADEQKTPQQTPCSALYGV